MSASPCIAKSAPPACPTGAAPGPWHQPQTSWRLPSAPRPLLPWLHTSSSPLVTPFPVETNVNLKARTFRCQRTSHGAKDRRPTATPSLPEHPLNAERIHSKRIHSRAYQQHAALWQEAGVMNSFKDQLRQVVRRLRRAPMFTVITLITLAAGVGANTVVFSVLEGVLLKSLPYSHPEELITVAQAAPGINIPELNMSPSNYFIYREQGQTFQDVGLYQGDSVSVTGIGEPEQVPSLNVSDATLPILGVQPMLGRTFRREDDLPGAPQTVLLTYGYWRGKFSGNPAA